VKYLIVIVLHT